MTLTEGTYNYNTPTKGRNYRRKRGATMPSAESGSKELIISTPHDARRGGIGYGSQEGRGAVARSGH